MSLANLSTAYEQMRRDLYHEKLSRLTALPCTCQWTFWVGPEGGGSRKEFECYRCAMLRDHKTKPDPTGADRGPNG